MAETVPTGVDMMDSDRPLMMSPRKAGFSNRVFSGAIVFGLAFFLLFLTMPRSAGVYDEGLVLVNAMRVGVGQVPHRDFYAYYGPAQFYILAGFFKIFGPSLLVERLYDLTLKSLLMCSIFVLVSQYFGRANATFMCVLGLLWLIQLDVIANPVVGVSIFNLLAIGTILPVFTHRVSPLRIFFSGGFAGMSGLFRYDTGIAAIGILVCLVAISAWLVATDFRGWLVSVLSSVWPCLLGFAAVVLPPALFYLAHGSLADFVADVVVYPAKYYHRARNLPFPGIHQRYDMERVFLPLIVIAIALIALYATWSRSARRADVDETQKRAWRGFLVSFTFLAAVMYLKGLVRISPVHLYLSTMAALLVLAALAAGRSCFGPTLRKGVTVLTGCYVLCAIAPLTQQRLWPRMFSTSIYLRERASGRLSEADRAWCSTPNPLTRGLCFDASSDRIQAIEFIRNHTQPGEEILSALSRNDMIFANDNILYFASERLPSTHWADFNPLVQNTLSIQTQMVDELRRNGPRYIVLESGFDNTEPNESSKSTGVLLLDRYLQTNYSPVATYGEITILSRRPGTAE